MYKILNIFYPNCISNVYEVLETNSRIILKRFETYKEANDYIIGLKRI